MAEKVSYISRFTLKLVEMVAAGIATAVSGYLVAHLGAYFFSPAPTSAPQPAAVQVAPSPAQSLSGTSKAAPKNPHAQTTKSASTESSEDRVPPAQDANPAAVQPTRATVNAKDAAAVRKHIAADPRAADSKPRDVEDKDSVEAQVRAALANVDANRPPLPEPPTHQANIPPAPPAAGAPNDAPASAGTAAVPPRTADLAPAPMQEPPAKTEPLSEVEIKSRPVADINSMSAPQRNEQENVQEDTGLIAAIKHIPDLLRPVAPAEDAPRPPLPVGQ